MKLSFYLLYDSADIFLGGIYATSEGAAIREARLQAGIIAYYAVPARELKNRCSINNSRISGADCMRNFVCWVLLIIAFCLSMYAGYFVVYKMRYAEGFLLSVLALAAWIASDTVGLDDEF